MVAPREFRLLELIKVEQSLTDCVCVEATPPVYTRVTLYVMRPGM